MATVLVKEDVLHTHATLVRVRHLLTELGAISRDACPRYDALNVSPLHVHKLTADHTKAILQLKEELDVAVQRAAHIPPLPEVPFRGK